MNDLSFHGQFPDVPSFRSAIGRIMSIRNMARRFGREMYCHRNVAHAQVTAGLSMPQVVGGLARDERQAVMRWLTRTGPFWEDVRMHGPDDYLECNGELVTDTAVGEAAYCCLHRSERRLVSVTPSSWGFSPVPVTWVSDVGPDRAVEVYNHWEEDELERALRAAPAPLETWEQLAVTSQARCPSLTFSADAFFPLRGQPFAGSAARRILFLLETLECLRCCFDEKGQRTPEGHAIYQNHFTGEKAFSDSSDAEKEDFQAELTFRHPTAPGETLFCTWHGKVNTPKIRIHFSWPMRADQPIYVVYVGPKKTKR